MGWHNGVKLAERASGQKGDTNPNRITTAPDPFDSPQRLLTPLIPPFDSPDPFDSLHEPGQRHPEIVAHHEDALDAVAVALPEGLREPGVLVVPVGVEPLLELVDDEDDVLIGKQPLALADGTKGLRQLQVCGQGRELSFQRADRGLEVSDS